MSSHRTSAGARAGANPQLAEQSPSRPLVRAAAALLALATLIVAATPALLVVQQRWLGDERAADALRPTWCEVEALCGLALPPYFLIVFGSTAALLLLALAGAGLLALPAGPLPVPAPGWRRLPGLAAAHVALVAAIGLIYAEHPAASGVAALGAALGLYLLWRRDTPPIFWVWSLALLLGSLWVNGWWFAVIGDEFAFYQYAVEYIGPPQEIPGRIFEGAAVYGAHPYFSSLLQAVSIWVFGEGSFGWRFSSIYLAAMAVPLVHSFQRTFLPAPIALLAALLLACSHYLLSFGKIGYNNLQALWVLGLALAAAAWAIRSRSWLAYAALGAALGLCFYVYPAALYVPPVALLLLLCYAPPWPTRRSPGAKGVPAGEGALEGPGSARPPRDQSPGAGPWWAMPARWALMGSVALALVAPLLLQPTYWEAKVAGTALYSPERVSTPEALARHVGTNLLYSLYAPLYTPHESHFVIVGYLDPLTAALSLVGLALALAAMWRSRFLAFLLLSYAALLFLVGASHDREFPSTTRMFLLLPWLCTFAAMALAWLGAALRRAGLPRGAVAGLGGATAVALVALNLYVAYPLAHQRMAGQYQLLETLLLRTALRAEAAPALRGAHFVIVNDPQSLHVPSLRELLALYGSAAPQEIVEHVISPTPAQTAHVPLLTDPRALVILSPRLDDAYLALLTRYLREHGRAPCPIRNSLDELRLTLWLRAEDAPLCEPLNAAPFRPFVPRALQVR